MEKIVSGGGKKLKEERKRRKKLGELNIYETGEKGGIWFKKKIYIYTQVIGRRVHFWGKIREIEMFRFIMFRNRLPAGTSGLFNEITLFSLHANFFYRVHTK